MLTTTQNIQDDSQWPYVACFNNGTEVATPVNCTINGKLPPWLHGKLYRAGPGIYDLSNKKSLEHWFDGIGITHLFEIKDGTVTYRNRITGKGRMATMEKKGFPSLTFGPTNDPCQTIFQKLFSFFQSDEPGISVTVSPNLVIPESNEPVCVVKTDANFLLMIDPLTLEPKKDPYIKYGVMNPELNRGLISMAHEELDLQTKSFINLVSVPGPNPEYLVFEQSQTVPASQATILARFNDPGIYYQHSFFSTSKYVVIPLWPLEYGWRGAKIRMSKCLTDAMEWHPQNRTRMLVISREAKKVVAEYSHDAEFCFHTVNAFDDPETGDIVLDYLAYKSGQVVTQFLVPDLRNSTDLAKVSKLREATSTEFKRLRLKDVNKAAEIYKPAGSLKSSAPKAEIVFSSNVCMELPRINPLWKRNPNYRYTYGLAAQHQDKHSHVLWDSIAKFDVKTQSISKSWSRVGFTPSEPVFIPRPGSINEDDGVLLSSVLDGFAGKSFLLILDASTFEEIASADVGIPLPIGLHGSFV